MSSKTSDQWLCDEIVNYVKDDGRKYSIAIEGPWGCGKTRFVESVLAPALQVRDKRVVRVSMFGLGNAEDLYEKLGAALIRMEDDNPRKTRKIIKAALFAIPGILSTMISKVAIPVKFDVGMKFLVDIVLTNKHVIVFDDVERRSESADDLALFGAVNELVEGRGQKVVFVTNSVGGDGVVGSSFDLAVREKLVWRVFRYEQDLEALVSDIFGGIRASVVGFDVLECVRAAVDRVSCASVRVMLRVEVYVGELLELDVFHDDEIYLANRKAAFIDLVEFALLVCSGRAPKQGDVSERKDLKHWNDPEYWHACSLYERYLEVPSVEAYFKPRRNDVCIDLDGDVRKYIAIRYPNSEDTQSVLDLKAAMNDGCSSFSDCDVVPLVSRLAAVIRRSSFSPIVLRDVVYWSVWFSEAGFEEAVSEEELLRCCKAVVDRDPQGALEFFKGNSSLLSIGERGDRILRVLSDYVSSGILLVYARRVHKCRSDGWTAESMLALLSDVIAIDVNCLLAVLPGEISYVFANLTPEKQEELRRLFRGSFPDSVNSRLVDWLSELGGALRMCDDGDHMTNVRRGWLISDVDALIQRYQED